VTTIGGVNYAGFHSAGHLFALNAQMKRTCSAKDESILACHNYLRVALLLCVHENRHIVSDDAMFVCT